MRRNWLAAAGVLALGLAVTTPALAADHLDGPKVKMDKTTDITDIYSWMSSDGSKVYLVMNVDPMAGATDKFSNAAAYVFHIASTDAFGHPLGANKRDIIVTFDANQAMSLWIVDKANNNAVLDYVTGDASATAGLVSTSGKVKAFAGLRDDPFFFNLGGFLDAAGTVHSAASALGPTEDAAGCPKVDSATSQALVMMLNHTSMGTQPPADFFAKLNVLSIVLAVDKTLLAKDGNIMSFWGSTNVTQ